MSILQIFNLVIDIVYLIMSVALPIFTVIYAISVHKDCKSRKAVIESNEEFKNILLESYTIREAEIGLLKQQNRALKKMLGLKEKEGKE